jgi:hypothetical protein
MVRLCSGGGPERKQIVLSVVLPNSSIHSMLKIDRQASNPDLEGSVYKVTILLILFSVSISSPDSYEFGCDVFAFNHVMHK